MLISNASYKHSSWQKKIPIYVEGVLRCTAAMGLPVSQTLAQGHWSAPHRLADMNDSLSYYQV